MVNMYIRFVSWCVGGSKVSTCVVNWFTNDCNTVI